MPALILLVLAVPTVAHDLRPVARAPARHALKISVVGKQWWWEFQYPERPRVVTGDEFHIPAGRKVRLELTRVRPVARPRA